MSASIADVRFLLPVPPDSAVRFGKDDRLASGLESVGVSVQHDVPDAGALLAIGTAEALRAAVCRRYPVLLADGRLRRGRAFREFALARFVALPGIGQPALLLPVEKGHVTSYALANWTFPSTFVRRGRNRAARELLGRRLVPPGLDVVSVAARLSRPPFLIGAAQSLGVPSGAGFFLRTGGRDPLSRSTFFLFESGAPEPRWVLKFARVRDYREPFDRDEAGLMLAAATSTSVRRHVPRLLGRIEAGGFHGSLEEAAVGRPLSSQLRTTGSAARKLALVNSVAEWILELGSTTRREGGSSEERRRLAGLLAGYPRATGIPAGLLDRVSEVPTVLQHNDLGCWNVIVSRDGFVAVDWESARAGGLPLWDLWYFLRDALAALDGVVAADQDAHFRALFAGELQHSAVLFRWTRMMVEALRVPEDAVGSLATLCWLHHARSHVARDAALQEHAPAAGAAEPYPFPSAWLVDPRLGPEWQRWRA